MKKRLLAWLAIIILVIMAFPMAGPLATAGEIEAMIPGTVPPGGITLLAASPPALETNKEVSPNPVCLNSEAVITLEVTGVGDPWLERQPLDVMFIFDLSGSIEGEKLAAAQAAAEYFITEYLDSTKDRVGVVSYAYTATLDVALTDVFEDVEEAIDAMVALGPTNIGAGIALATSELEDNGREEAIQVEIMFSDGSPNFPSGTGHDFYEPDAEYAREEAQAAHDSGLILHNISLTEVELQKEFLDDLAAEDHIVYGYDGLTYVSGGTFYDTASEANMDYLYAEIETAFELSHVAGRDAVVTEVLPVGVHYVDGSANPEFTSVDGQTMTWNLGIIDIGVTETITFSVTFDNAGEQLADVYPDTRVTYTNYEGSSTDTPFPETYIEVTGPPAATASSNSPVYIGYNIRLYGGPDAMDSYSWTGPDGFTSEEQNPTISDATPGMAGEYTLVVTDGCGQTGSATTNVVVTTTPPIPTATADSNSPVYVGNTIELYGGPNYMDSYSWTGPDGFTSDLQNPTIPGTTLDMAGDYTLVVTNEYAQTDSATTTVVVYPAEPPKATADSNSPVYVGETIELYGGPDGMDSYSWTGPDGFSSDLQNPTIPDATNNMEGDYTLTVTNIFGSDSATTNVDVKRRSSGGGSSSGPLVLTVDFEGKISQGNMGSTGWLYETINAPSPDDMHLVELKKGMKVTGDDGGAVTWITIRGVSGLDLPENTEIVGKAYEFTPATFFSDPIRLTLGYDINKLPERTVSVYLGYYSPETGWEKVATESNIVAELGKLTAPLSHFSTYAILADIEPQPALSSPPSEPAPAHFTASGLNITPELGGSGDTINITANITNDGGRTGTYTATLRINGKASDNREVTLEPGESELITFTVSGMAPGEYTVDVSQLTGSFTLVKMINWWIIAAILAGILLLGAGLFWLFGILIPPKNEEAES